MNIIEASHLCNKALGHQKVYLSIDGRVWDFSGKVVILDSVFAGPLSKTADTIEMEIRINGHETFHLALRKITGKISENGEDMEVHGWLPAEDNIALHIHIKDWGSHQNGKVYNAYEDIT